MNPELKWPELKWEVFYPHPALRVWRALTDPVALSEWLQPEEDVLDYGIVETVEQQRVSYSWITRDCEAMVTFELQAVDGGTKLRLRMEERKAIGSRVHLALDWLLSYLDRAVVDTSGHVLVFAAALENTRG
jgi:uncharacterized protein YndB with AHSA1/START domain